LISEVIKAYPKNSPDPLIENRKYTLPAVCKWEKRVSPVKVHKKKERERSHEVAEDTYLESMVQSLHVPLRYIPQIRGQTLVKCLERVALENEVFDLPPLGWIGFGILIQFLDLVPQVFVPFR
jgi:hypothetical protein